MTKELCCLKKEEDEEEEEERIIWYIECSRDGLALHAMH